VTSIVPFIFLWPNYSLPFYHYFFQLARCWSFGEPDRLKLCFSWYKSCFHHSSKAPGQISWLQSVSHNSVPVAQGHLKRSKTNQISLSDAHETSSDPFSPLTYYTSWCTISRRYKQTLRLLAFQFASTSPVSLAN